MNFLIIPVVAILCFAAYKMGKTADERQKHRKMIDDWIFNIERPDIK